MESCVSYLLILFAAFVLVLLPAICIGVLSIIIYYAFKKINPTPGKLAPVAGGVGLSILTPLYHAIVMIAPFSFLIQAGIIAMGVLTPFMLIEEYFLDLCRYKILLLGSVVAISARLLYGFAIISDNEESSPIFRMLTSLSSSDTGFLIMNSIALYLEMILLSTVIFGVLFLFGLVFKKIVETRKYDPDEIEEGRWRGGE